MEIATAEFLREIRRSHHVYSYVDVISPNLEVVRLSATGGGVTEDATAAVRRRCTLTIVDADGDLTPKRAEDLLTPYGTELRPYRGVVYADGTAEVMPLGVFRLSQVDVDDSVGGSPDIRIEGFDRSRTVDRDKFIEPYTVAAGTNLITAIKDVLARTYPDLEYDSITTTMTNTAPLIFDANKSPWEAATSMAKSLGCELYFDATGRVVIAPPIDIDALPAPAFTFIEGKGCTMTNLQSKFTDEPGFNGIILTGESVGDEEPPVRAVAWDEDPTSPTYHLGPYGEVPDFVTDANVKTEGEAESAARALLQGRLGFSDQLSLTAWPNPALNASDVAQVERERTGASGLYTIDSITIPMAARDTSSIVLRRKRGIVIPEDQIEEEPPPTEEEQGQPEEETDHERGRRRWHRREWERDWNRRRRSRHHHWRRR